LEIKDEVHCRTAIGDRRCAAHSGGADGDGGRSLRAALPGFTGRPSLARITFRALAGDLDDPFDVVVFSNPNDPAVAGHGGASFS
jgi:hypothetical protein